MNKLETILNPSESLIFLAGAGISMELPSGLPSAQEFVKTLVNICAPSEEIDKILK